MKKIILPLLVLFTTAISAQKVDYTKVLDDPSKHPWLSINLELFQMDLGLRNLDGFAFNAGLWGYVEPVYNRIGVNYTLRRSYLLLGKLGNPNYPGNTEIDLGGYFIYKNKQRTKNTKIVLKVESEKNKEGNDVSTTTFIKIPAEVKTMSGFRGGINHKSGPMNFEIDGLFAEDVKIDLQTKISSQALYAGLFTRKIRNIVIKDPIFGRSGNSSGQEFYVDGLFFLSNKFTSLASGKEPNIKPGGENVSDTVKNNTAQGILGFRAGYKIYQVAPKSETGKKFGMAAGGEFGYRPYQGWFITASLGITIGKRRP